MVKAGGLFLILVFALFASADASSAQTAPDLVDQFLQTINNQGNSLAFDPAPEATGFDDEAGDLFTLGADIPAGPAHVDIVQTRQFGFSLTPEASVLLFADGGALDCAQETVSCPRYEIQSEPFAEGVIVVGVELAAAPVVAAGETFTVAVVAFDDNWPTAQDPRPNSPFVGTNKAWRLDISGDGSLVSFLQITTGPYEEFQTDARVLTNGNLFWFVIPPPEWPLRDTISGWFGHTFQDPAADVDGPAGGAVQSQPSGLTGSLGAGQSSAVTTTTAGPTTTVGAAATTTVPSATAPPDALPAKTLQDANSRGVAPLLIVAVVIIVLIAILIAFFRPKRKCEKEYLAWQQALAVCEEAKAAVDRAESEAGRLREELDRLRREYPPLEFEESDQPFAEMDDGETVSALDMALVGWDNRARQAPVSEASSTSRPEIARDAAAQRQRLRDEYERMKATESDLMSKLADAEANAREARKNADEMCALAEEAHRAYLICMGEIPPPGPAGGGADEGEPPPEEPPPPPESSPPPPPVDEPKPTEPKPVEPPPPVPPPPPAPPVSGYGGGEEVPSGCVEGSRRETDVTERTFEMLRDKGHAKIAISTDLSGSAQEWNGIAIGAIAEAGQWVAAKARIKSQTGVLYTIDIAMQFEKRTVRCSTLEVCRNGRWERMSFRQREESEPEYFEKTVHREEADAKILRQILQTARNTAQAGGREAFDQFCR